jgi:hypothetical protein
LDKKNKNTGDLELLRCKFLKNENQTEKKQAQNDEDSESDAFDNATKEIFVD